MSSDVLVFRVTEHLQAGRMPRFMSDQEYENESGDTKAIMAKADAFIENLEGQLEAQKATCADLDQKLQTVVLLLPEFT